MSEIGPSLVPDCEHDERGSDLSDAAPTCEYSTRLARAARFFAWDGGLPLAVAVIPFALDALGGELLAGLACFLVPLVAAFARCEVGLKQIITRVGDPPPISRQVLLAAGIVVLLVFEVAISVSLKRGNAPIELWRLVAGLYAVYLALIWAALHSTSGAARFVPGSPADSREKPIC